MKIIDSTKYYELKEPLSLIVLHHFSMYRDINSHFHTIDDIVEFLARSDYPASANYLVDVTGDIYQIVPPTYASWHAGYSHYHGKHIEHSVNTFSVGIEIVRSEENNFEYSGAQYLAVSGLCNDLMETYEISPLDITTHAYIRREYNMYAEGAGLEQKETKNDPYHFDFELLMELMYNGGLTHLRV